MMKKLRQILEMIRFSHTIFALPFALLAAIMAWAIPLSDGNTVSFNALHLVGILVCMVGARSAGMAFNRLVDRDVDAENPRTAKRHIPAGILSVKTVALFTVGCSALFVAGTLLFLPNWLPLVLSVPILLILMAYSLTKRVTSLSHFWLGLSLALAPMAAWIAIRGSEVILNPYDLIPSGLLGLSVLFWVAGFDIIYACQDFDFDKDAKLFSIPKRLGVKGALRLAAICHAVMIGILVMLSISHQVAGPDVGLAWIYWVGILILACLLIYEHSLVKPNDLTRVNVAFFNVNAIVSLGMLVVVSIDLFV